MIKTSTSLYLRGMPLAFISAVASAENVSFWQLQTQKGYSIVLN